MTLAAVGLGSNLGDRLAHLRWAVERLEELGSVARVSSLYESDPVGGPPQGRFLNAVVVVDTVLAPLDILAALQRIEGEAGRVRDVRWGPRVLDLDLLVVDAERLHLPTLQLPHPRARERRFVLAPLAEVWPEADVGGGTARERLRSLRGQRVWRWRGDWTAGPPRIGLSAHGLVAAQAVLLVADGMALLALGSAPPVPRWRSISGAALALAGLGLSLAAASRLGSELSAHPQPRPEARLHDSGPYGLVRHPIYGGILLGSTGAAVWRGSLPALAVTGLLALLFRVKSALEERALTLLVPGYPEYRARTRRRLLPFLW